MHLALWLGIKCRSVSMDKILLIDDDRSALALMSRMITALGYECVAVRDPQEGLVLLKTDKFAVVITDLVMPEIDGLEVLKQSLRINKTLKLFLSHR